MEPWLFTEMTSFRQYHICTYLHKFAALSYLFAGVVQITNNTLFILKKTQCFLYIQVVCALVNIALNILLIPTYGFLSAALTTLISYILMLIFVCYFSFNTIKFVIDYVFILKSIIASVIMGMVLITVQRTSIIWLFATILLGMLIYFLMLFISKGITKDELSNIISLMKR